MDDKLLAPALPAAPGTDVLALPPSVPAALSATSAVLPVVLAIGGVLANDVQIGMADRTPWLAMAPAPLPAPSRQDVSDEVGGETDGAMPVARRARAGWRAARPGEGCGAGVCVCGRCDEFLRRP